MRRTAWLFVLVAFVFSCGGQWYALQCVAWVKMIHDYAEIVPFPQAVSMTFSGQYPCPICKAIAEKKQSENMQFCSIEKQEKKFFPPVAVAPIRPAVSNFEYAEYRSFLRLRTEPPPTPPPRRALG